MSNLSFAYRLVFYGDWHTGSGLAAGAEVNLTVARDRKGHPYVPGKTLKGLLHEAALDLRDFGDSAAITADFIKTVFGEGEDKRSSNAPVADEIIASKSFFSNATLSAAFRAELGEGEQPFLFRTLNSTAIDEQGVAKDKSLRSLEVTIPLVLFARVDQLPEEYHPALKRCCNYVKRLGQNRNRGLGKCQLQPINQTAHATH